MCQKYALVSTFCGIKRPYLSHLRAHVINYITNVPALSCTVCQHMVVGGFPVLAISLWKQDPGVSGHLGDLNLQDWVCLFHASVFGT